jgi:hypothetical protein
MEVCISSGGGEKSRVFNRLPGLWHIVSSIFIIIVWPIIQHNSFPSLLNREIEMDRLMILLSGLGLMKYVPDHGT